MIVDPVTLVAFVPAGIALNLTPGADMMFCLAQGLKGGARPAVFAAAGISAGGMINVLLAGLGIGALVDAHPGLFEAIRWGGVAYLVVLAIRAVRAPVGVTQSTAVSPRRAFRDAMVVSVTNPKVILFILAFLPQFVDPGRGSVLGQFVVLGAAFSLTGFCVNAGVGFMSGGIGRVLVRSPAIGRTMGLASAAVFCLLALKLALESRPT